MSHEKKDEPLNPDRMRTLLASAAVQARQTKVTVCMVRTVLQERTKRKSEKPDGNVLQRT
jgi:hypothetical protein